MEINQKLIDGLDMLTKEEISDLAYYFKLIMRLETLKQIKSITSAGKYGEYSSFMNDLMGRLKEQDPNKELAKFTNDIMMQEWIDELDKICKDYYEAKVVTILEKVVAGSFCYSYLQSLVNAWEEKAGVNNNENQN